MTNVAVALLRLRMDYRRVENGDWVDNIPDMPGLRLKVRGIGCRALEHAMHDLKNSEHRRPGRQSLVKFALLPVDERERLVAEKFADALLLDWEGLEDEVGVPLRYSAERARQLLSDPELRALLDAVRFAAAMITPTEPPADNSDLSEEDRCALEADTGAKEAAA